MLVATCIRQETNLRKNFIGHNNRHEPSGVVSTGKRTLSTACLPMLYNKATLAPSDMRRKENSLLRSVSTASQVGSTHGV